MNWQYHLEELSKKGITSFRPKGNSMEPRISSGQKVTVVSGLQIAVDDVVFCRISGRYYVHLVKAIQGNRFLIGNNHGRINGWTSQVFGKVIKVE